jgi:hypothetical protein
MERNILFNRTKISLRILYGLAFIAIGFWLLFGNTQILDTFPRLADPNLKKFMGFLIIALTSIGIMFLIKCLIANKVGFEIDNDGILDRTSIFSKGKILWSDIENVEKTTMKFFIDIPALKISLKNSTKPKLFSAGLLDVSLDDLIKNVTEKFKETTANTR